MKEQLLATLENSKIYTLAVADEDGMVISRIGTTKTGVSVFNNDDWPAIISFLKPRLIALDSFWSLAKNSFDM